MNIRHARPTTVLALALAAIVALAPLGPALAAPPAGPPHSQAIAELAFVYGYPLVLLEVTKQVATNVRDASSAFGRAPINQFSNNPLPDASYTDIVLPSVSTPYSNAFLDLSKGPVILHLPDLKNRFFLMQVMDAWTNVGGESDACLHGLTGFCGLGTRYDTGPGYYAFVGPGWDGKLPPGITQVVQIPTSTGWIAGRTLTDGTPADLATVTAIQQQYTLTPANHFGKRYAPPTHSPVDPKIDMTTTPRDQVNAMDAGTYLALLAKLMGPNPPAAADAPVLAELAKIGFVPGHPFQIERLDPATRAALEQGVADGKARVATAAANLQPTLTNWSMSLGLGAYGVRYLERAATAYGGLGANLYLDAVYAGAHLDAHGEPLDGSKFSYKLHFPKNSLPPSNPAAFWSVTLYNAPLENLFDNPLHRNGVGIPTTQGQPICLNADGSLDIFIQPLQPADPLELCNWLPSPSGRFLLLLRMYWPGPELFHPVVHWIPPAVHRQ
jgi:hypothetical protein